MVSAASKKYTKHIFVFKQTGTFEGKEATVFLNQHSPHAFLDLVGILDLITNSGKAQCSTFVTNMKKLDTAKVTVFKRFGQPAGVRLEAGLELFLKRKVFDNDVTNQRLQEFCDRPLLELLAAYPYVAETVTEEEDTDHQAHVVERPSEIDTLFKPWYHKGVKRTVRVTSDGNPLLSIIDTLTSVLSITNKEASRLFWNTIKPKLVNVNVGYHFFGEGSTRTPVTNLEGIVRILASTGRPEARDWFHINAKHNLGYLMGMCGLPYRDVKRELGGDLYMVQEREFVSTNQMIFKIGKSTMLDSRLKSYSKGTMVHSTRVVPSFLYYAEKELITGFIVRFGPPVFGKEYFKCENAEIAKCEFNRLIELINLDIDSTHRLKVFEGSSAQIEVSTHSSHARRNSIQLESSSNEYESHLTKTGVCTREESDADMAHRFKREEMEKEHTVNMVRLQVEQDRVFYDAIVNEQEIVKRIGIDDMITYNASVQNRILEYSRRSYDYCTSKKARMNG